MSILKLEELFTVDAPLETVWKFLADPAEVAACLPGARFDGRIDGEPDTFGGAVKVKVGPVISEFRGKATVRVADDAKHTLKIQGRASDEAGGGSARVDLTCRVQPALDVPEGLSRCEVVVIAEVEVVGKVVRFGRGMIEGVSKQMFKHFVSRARSKLTGSAIAGGSTSQDLPAVPLDKASSQDSAPAIPDRGLTASGTVTISPELLALAEDPNPVASGSHPVTSGSHSIASGSHETGSGRHRTAPEPQNIAPETEKAAPEPQNIAPETEKAAPEPQNIAPETEKAAPAKEKAAPAKEKAAPAKEKAAPAKEKAAPGRGKPPPARPSDITTAIIPRPKLRPHVEAALQKAESGEKQPAKKDETTYDVRPKWGGLFGWLRGLLKRLFGRG